MSENNFEKTAKCRCENRVSAVSRIHRVYGVILAIAVVLLAICFAVSCVNIYNEGGSSPFSAESIAAHFERIAIPTYVSIAALIFGVIIAIVMPEQSGELGKIYNPYIPLKALSGRLNLAMCDHEIAMDILRERRRRGWLRAVCAILCILLLGGAALFALDFSRYTATDINSEVLGCTIISLPLSFGALILIFACSLINSASASYELDLTMWAVKRQVSALNEKKEKNTVRGGNTLLNLFRITVLAVGIVFVILGVNNGGMEQVLGKAVRICTECIGLG